MIVVSDTTAITSLLKIGRASLLNDLFGSVLIPDAVREELLQYHSEIPKFLEVRVVQNQNLVQSLRLHLDKGESEAIVLAEEIKADSLLIDEKQGRAIAENRGLQCLGLAGALLLAKQSGQIPSLGEILQALETDANFYLDPHLKHSLLNRAREENYD